MSGPTEDVDAANRFREDARSAGLALSSSRGLNSRLAAAVVAVVVAASVGVGYATNWVNLGHARDGPLDQLPGCSGGGVSIHVATESEVSGPLTTAWPALATAFSAATGGCLSVESAATGDGFARLASLATATLVGPALPPSASSDGLAAATYDVPLLVSPVVVLVNDAGLPVTINLSSDVLAGIYLGAISSWSDPAVVADNPGIRSNEPVTPVHLDGPSQADRVFSTYLAQWNATFRATVGSGANLSWPTGSAASASNMTEAVERTPGAIGFEATDVCRSVPADIVCAAVETGDGGFVRPTPSAVSAAANIEANSTAAGAGSWANVTGVAPTTSTAYPMIETTFAVVYRDLGTAYGSSLSLNASKWLIALLFWIASNTSGVAGEVAATDGYSTLPGGMAITAEEAALNVTYLGNWILIPASALTEGPGESGGETGEF